MTAAKTAIATPFEAFPPPRKAVLRVPVVVAGRLLEVPDEGVVGTDRVVMVLWLLIDVSPGGLVAPGAPDVVEETTTMGARLVLGREAP
jgi:hypothetical protein